MAQLIKFKTVFCTTETIALTKSIRRQSNMHATNLKIDAAILGLQQMWACGMLWIVRTPISYPPYPSISGTPALTTLIYKFWSMHTVHQWSLRTALDSCIFPLKKCVHTDHRPYKHLWGTFSTNWCLMNPHNVHARTQGHLIAAVIYHCEHVSLVVLAAS